MVVVVGDSKPQGRYSQEGLKIEVLVGTVGKRCNDLYIFCQNLENVP